MTIKFTEKQITTMQTALDKWGTDAQTDQTIEECAELIVALNKHVKRTPQEGTLKNIIDEIADVEMMLAQMRLVFGISDEVIHERISEKFKKLEKYLKDDEI